MTKFLYQGFSNGTFPKKGREVRHRLDYGFQEVRLREHPDAPHAEFFHGCVRGTIEEDLPNETDFLRRHDLLGSAVTFMIDMPDRTVDRLFRFLHQNSGRLSKRAREREFRSLTTAEIEMIEALYDEMIGCAKAD